MKLTKTLKEPTNIEKIIFRITYMQNNYHIYKPQDITTSYFRIYIINWKI